jgi:FKBP-type peptidyl-prolyl cis-trans isomerase
MNEEDYAKDKNSGWLIWVIGIGIILIGGWFLFRSVETEEEATQWSNLSEVEAMEVFYEMQNEWARGLASVNQERFDESRGEVGEFYGGVDELLIRDIVVGEGREVGEGDFNYLAYYIGFLADGTIFGQSFDENGELLPPLRVDENMILGWSQGVVGMKLGGVRVITIPSFLGYGEEGVEESIPPNATLRFIVMLVEKVPFPEGIVEVCEIAFKSQLGEATRSLCEVEFGSDERE